MLPSLGPSVIARNRSRTVARSARSRPPLQPRKASGAGDLDVLATLRDQLQATDPQLAASWTRPGVLGGPVLVPLTLPCSSGPDERRPSDEGG